MVLLSPGTRVVSARFGSGVVQECSPAGVQILPDKLGMLVRVPLDDLQITSAPSSAPTPLQEAKPKWDSRAALAAAIDALRFGVVPRDQLCRLTVGYEHIESWTRSRLPHRADNRPAFSEVCAPFGYGKSHHLQAIRAVSARDGYVVAHAEINGNDVTFSDPAKLLCVLLSSVQLPEVDCFHPNWELYTRALQRNPAGLLTLTEPYQRVHSNVQTLDIVKRCSLGDEYEEKLDALLAGNSDYAPTYLRSDLYREITDPEDRQYVTPTSLIGRGVDTRPTDFAQALLGYAAVCHHAGFKGLVLTIDEFETEYFAASRSRLMRIKILLGTLAAFLESSDTRAGAPLALFVATVGQEGTERDPLLKPLSSCSRGESRELPSWKDESLIELAEKLHTVYSEAYEIQPRFSRRDITNLAGSLKAEEGVAQVRQFIRSYIALLDQRYGPPSA